MIKKQFWTFTDSWPWVALLALLVGVTTKAILYANTHGYDAKGFVVLAITAGVFISLIALRYVLRKLIIDNWNNAFQTRLGAAVIPNDVVDVPFRGVDQTCDDAAFFWKDYAIKNLNLTASSAQALIATAFSGATIACSSKPIVAGNKSWSGKLMGAQDGQNIAVVYDKKIVLHDSDFLQLVKHEVSHLCLSALGVDPGWMGANHHEIFAKLGYC